MREFKSRGKAFFTGGKKAVPADGLFFSLTDQNPGSGGFGRGLFGKAHSFFALDVVQPAFFLNFFVQLFAHKWLYFVRVMRFRYATMNFYALRFNIYLVLIIGLVLGGGCKSTPKDSKDDKAVSAVRVHLESPTGLGDTTQVVSVIREDPVSVTILSAPVLTESDVVAARVLDTTAGFAVELKFSSTGTLLLEEYSASNPGKHFVIFGQWGEKGTDGRWLAAPLITHRITDGILSFTPDMNRDDAYRLVFGLNNVAKKVAKDAMK